MPNREPQDQTVVQPILRPAERGPAHAPGGRGRDHRFQQWLPAIAFLILVALAIGVFVYLPRMVEPVTPEAPPATTGNETAQAPPAEQSVPDPEPQTIDYLQLAREMGQAEQARGAFEALLQVYEQRGAREWAGDLFVSAHRTGEQALRQFEARQFRQARASYDAALAQMQQVADLAKRLVTEQLEAGAQALEQGRSLAARQAFEFALRVEPDNARAEHGLKRAGTLERVFELMNAAQVAEDAGELQIALQRYKEAADLDPDMKAAAEGLTRVQNRIASDRFAAAMSEAVAALSEGRPSQARAALERARAIRPQAQEVLDGLARAGELERQQAVLEHRREAERLEASERWKEALGQYEAALKIDPTLAFALEGKARVQPRLTMHEQFELLIGDPSRLLSPAVRNQARALLAAAGKIAPPGPTLTRQIERLDAALKAAETPVPVVLQSDNQTEVVIHRVGRLGAFAQRRLELLPGEYVIVGTREGYRDVRKELTVLPGQQLQPVTVRCEEPI